MTRNTCILYPCSISFECLLSGNTRFVAASQSESSVSQSCVIMGNKSLMVVLNGKHQNIGQKCNRHKNAYMHLIHHNDSGSGFNVMFIFWC